MQIGLEIHIALFTQQAPFTLDASELWDARAADHDRGCTGARAESGGSTDARRAAFRVVARDGLRRVAYATRRRAHRRHERAGLEAVVARATSSRGGTCCYWTLRLARDLAGVSVPDTVLDGALAAPAGVACCAGSRATSRSRHCRRREAGDQLRIAGARALDARDPTALAGARVRRGRGWIPRSGSGDRTGCTARGRPERAVSSSHGFGLLRSVAHLMGS